MSKRTPSQTSNSDPNLYHSFEYLFGRGKRTLWHKVERWAANQRPPYSFLLLHVIKKAAELYTGMEVEYDIGVVDDVERMRRRHKP